MADQVAIGSAAESIKSADINDGSSGDNTIIAAVSGKRIAVLGILLVAVGTVNMEWWDGAAGTKITGDVNAQAREGYVLPVGSPTSFWWIGTTNTALVLNLSAAIAVDGLVTYREID